MQNCLKAHLDTKKHAPAILQDSNSPEDQGADGHNPFRPADGEQEAEEIALVGDEELSAEVDKLLADMDARLSEEATEVCGKPHVLLVWLA